MGKTYIGYKDGSSEGWNEYGLRLWQRGFKDDRRPAEELKLLQRFRAEWAEMQGPEFRRTSSHWHRKDAGLHITSDEYHRYLERTLTIQASPLALRNSIEGWQFGGHANDARRLLLVFFPLFPTNAAYSTFFDVLVGFAFDRFVAPVVVFFVFSRLLGF